MSTTSPNTVNLGAKTSSTFHTFMCKFTNAFAIPKRFQSNIDVIFNNDSYRWVILFICVFFSYIYLFYQANTYFDSSNNTEEPNEHRETALLLNPDRGGYNVVRGDISSPSLFEWNTSEYVLIAIVCIVTFLLAWVVFFNPADNMEKESKYIQFLSFLLIWSHTVMLLFYIPVNAFHQRMLYNLRSFAAQVCNNPLKELWLAFLFIVLVPIPGSRSHTERIWWLILKLGIFFIAQNILIGSPNYKVESADEKKSLPDTTSQFVGYGIFVLIIVLLFYNESCKAMTASGSQSSSNTL
jgi:hypothetical protein